MYSRKKAYAESFNLRGFLFSKVGNFRGGLSKDINRIFIIFSGVAFSICTDSIKMSI